ncbi:MAG: hypothetical protein ACK2VD_00880 [Anaerolineae bacterium]|jgi:hypothetical protein
MCRRRFWIFALLAVAAVLVLAAAAAFLFRFAWWHSYGMRGPMGWRWDHTLPVRPWLHRPGLPLHRPRLGFPVLLFGLGLLCPAGLALVLVALLASLFHHPGRRPGAGRRPGLSGANRQGHEPAGQHDVPGPGVGPQEPFNAKAAPSQRAEESPGDKPDQD